MHSAELAHLRQVEPPDGLPRLGRFGVGQRQASKDPACVVSSPSAPVWERGRGAAHASPGDASSLTFLK